MLATSETQDEPHLDDSERERSEAYARQVSFQIDCKLKAERLVMKKEDMPIKILLLGQSESGKTTVIKSKSIASININVINVIVLAKTFKWHIPMMLSSRSEQHGKQSSG